jgi:RNA polymerase sigma-70 factor (ECF subfamily)
VASDPGADGRGTSVTLLQRLRANEADAWRRLVHLSGPLVRYWCARWGVTDQDAEDVTQEVFAAAATGLAGFRRDRPGDTFRGWLHGVTRNKLLLRLRRRDRQPQAVGGTDALLRLQELADGTAADPGEDPPDELGGLYHRALELVRSEFEDRTWQMFWENVVEGQPPDAIAAERGVSTAAVRQARSRVLRHLKEEVGDLIA